MKSALRIVEQPKATIAPYDDAKGIKAVMGFKSKLQAAAVRYIVEGRDGSPNDRLRAASDLSGITRTALWAEVTKQC
jgi:hypothetical protein